MADEEEQRVAAKEHRMARGHGDCPHLTKANFHQNETEEGRASETSSSSSSSAASAAGKSSTSMNKGKSCKGILYYSSTFKSNSRNPLCVGFTRSLPSVPRYIVGESELEASKAGRSLTDFKYISIGYSVYPDLKNRPDNAQITETELPVCVGLEVLVDLTPNTSNSASASSSAPVLSREDSTGVPSPQSRKPASSFGERFTRNAGLVAMGVAKNMCKIGNQIKESVDDILYPYRRRPK